MPHGGVEVEQQKLRAQAVEQGWVSECLGDKVRVDRDANAGKGALQIADGNADRGPVIAGLPLLPVGETILRSA